MNEQLRAFLKSIGVDIEGANSFTPGENEEQSDLVKFAKSAISPADLAVSGDISASRASQFIDLIEKENSFLSKTTVIPMESLKSEYDVWDMANGVLVRVAEGSEPTATQKKNIENNGRVLDAKPMQLFADVLRATIINNQNRPNLTSWLDQKFATKFGNELVYLGFTGENDTYSPANFKNLNKGWITLAKEVSGVNKSTYAADDAMVKRLEALVDNADDNMGDDAKILIHRKDFLKYCIEIGTSTNTASLITQAAAEGFGGYGFEITNNMPSGSYMLTPTKNLVTGIAQKIYRSREWHSRKRAIEYTFDIYADYDIAVPKLVSFVSQAQ